MNSLVFGLFAAVALLIAVVGVAGVLAFSVIARTREFGIRLALGSKPESILRPVLAEGAAMAGAGVLAGAAFGLLVALVAGSYFGDLKMPGALPVIVSAFVLLGAAVVGFDAAGCTRRPRRRHTSASLGIIFPAGGGPCSAAKRRPLGF